MFCDDCKISTACYSERMKTISKVVEEFNSAEAAYKATLVDYPARKIECFTELGNFMRAVQHLLKAADQSMCRSAELTKLVSKLQGKNQKNFEVADYQKRKAETA
jgi:hypothetical protein